jgi:VPDSG-CTERM motif
MVRSPPFFFVKTGSVDDQAFKFNAVDLTLSDITVDPHIPGLIAATGAFNGDGTGEFDFGINCPTCGGGGASDQFGNDIVFHVANASITDLTQPNNLGIIFVADVINTTEGNGNTGPIDVGGPSRTPDSGSTALLLGLGLFGLGFVRMPLRKKA